MNGQSQSPGESHTETGDISVRKVILLGLVGCLCAGFFLAGQHSDALMGKPRVTTRESVSTERTSAPAVSKGGPLPAQETTEAGWELFETRKKTVEQIVSEIAATNSDSRESIARKADLIELAGKLRGDVAVPALIKSIDFRSGPRSSLDRSPDAAYPAVGALSEIGKAGSAAALDELKRVGSSAVGDFDIIYRLPYQDVAVNPALLRTYLLTKVVKRVEGTEVATFLIEQEINRTKPAQQPALQMALQILVKERHY